MPNAAPKLPPVAQPSQQFSLNAPRNTTPLNSPWPKPQGGQERVAAQGRRREIFRRRVQDQVSEP